MDLTPSRHMHRDACPEAEPHRFWDILELAHKVIEASSRQYQGRLAQINKYFWPIARQHLWKSIPRVDPLLDLVLRELGDKKDPYQAEEVARFNVYAPAVQDIETTINALGVKTLLQISASSGGAFILPNLKHARLSVPHAVANQIHNILPPTLYTLQLHYPYTPVSLPDCAFPALTSFIVSAAEDELPAPFGALANFVCAHESTLEIVDINDVGRRGTGVLPFLGVLAALPRLQTLGLNWVRIDGSATVAFPPGYESLKRIRLHSAPHDFLLSISPTQIEAVDLTLEENNLIPSMAILPNFPSLSSIHISFKTRDFPAEAVELLAHCRGVTNFRLSLGLKRAYLLENGEENLRRLAQAWPDLRSLEIETRCSHIIPLRGLECLAKHCPKLERLRLSVDAVGVGDAPVTCSGTDLKDLHLGWTRTDWYHSGDSMQSTANFIGDMWPNREISRSSWDEYGAGATILEALSRRWREVWALADARSKKWRDEHV